jgi:hypothetical protein
MIRRSVKELAVKNEPLQARRRYPLAEREG